MANANGTGFFTYDPTNDFSLSLRTPLNNQNAVFIQAFPPCSASESLNNLSIDHLPGGNAALSASYYYDFYYRIWIVPSILNLSNPSRNVAITYGIWNAYPEPATNELTALTIEGSSGVSYAIAIPTVFSDLEYISATFEFTNSAPIDVSQVATFTFQEGSGTFTLTADLAALIAIPPENPVEETWEFLSDIMIAFDGTEQRVALREAPRRTLKYDTLVLSPSDYQQMTQLIYSNLTTKIILPWYPYLTTVSTAVAAGAETIQADTTRSDLQVGDYVVFVNSTDMMVSQVTSLTSSSLGISSPTTFDLKVGDSVIPAFSSYLPNKTAVQMKGYQGGKISLNAATPGPPHSTLSRPGSATTFTMLNSMIVITWVPLGNEEDDFTVETGGEMVDYKTGVGILFTSYQYQKFMGTRQWFIQRYFQPAQMDWWRDFAQAVRGQQTAFLLPTFRPDLTQDPTTVLATASVTLVGNSYSLLFFDADPAFRYIGMKSATGWTYHQVISVSLSTETGGDVLAISPGVPTNLVGGFALSLCLVIRCRLASDIIKLTHTPLSSVIELSFMSTDQ